MTIVFLFLSGFIRYFLLNDIPLEIAQLGNYLYEIDKISLNCAFFGIIIILSRFFGFVPFNFSTNALSDKLPPLILFQQRLYSTSIALILFLKFYPVFQDLFLEYETFLTGYLILNLVWYILILFKTQNAFKIVANSLALHFSYALIVIFSPSELSADFIYFAFILILSYLLISLILTVLCNHFKTRSITDFKTIGDKTRIVQIYTILSFLNIAKVAPFGLFVPNIILCVNLFSIPFEDINTIIPYLMVFALLIYAIFIINIICKLNINIQNDAIDFQFKKSEFLILTLLIFTIIGFCLCPQYFFNEFLISIESF